MKTFKQQFSRSISDILLILFVVFTLLSSSIQSANATMGANRGIERTRECNSNGDVGGDGLHFSAINGGKDLEFVLSNPICLTVILTTYTVVKIAIARMNGMCGSGSSTPRVLPSPIMDAYDITRATVRAATGNAACATSLSYAAGAYAVAIGTLGTIHLIGEKIYNNTKLCGADWLKANPSTYNISTGDYKTTVDNTIAGYFYDLNGNDAAAAAAAAANLDLSNQTYREWYYGGREFKDNPVNVNGVNVDFHPGSAGGVISNADDGACYDPTRAGNPKQKYYLRGSTGNYNCEQYDIRPGQTDPRDGGTVTTTRVKELQSAYKCCRKRSTEYVCIDYSDGNNNLSVGGNKEVFCKAGRLCTIQGITFSISSKDNGRLICAETYSLCPYNFTLQGGTEYCDYYKDGNWNSSTGRWDMISASDIENGNCGNNSEIRNNDCSYNDKANKCKNYCQYLTHCLITSDSSYEYESSLNSSPYFSSACIDFIGDSQNKTGYNDGSFIMGSQKHFSAPIAQCVKETLENLFYNRFGHSECHDKSELPSADGSCYSGQYAKYNVITDYKKGDQANNVSFFSTIQNVLQDIVKMVLILSITFYGMNILLGKSDIRSKKDILLYLLKMGLVLFFSTGDAWQSFFFKGVYGASAQFSEMVFKIDVGYDDHKKDGCQFGTLTNSSGMEVSSGKIYPEGKSYLAIWDTLDCKIMRYLGYGPEASVANIASLIIASYFTQTVGLYFALSVMFFGFFFIAATIRALHIFLSSALSIIIMVFISPIIIPTVLFERTKDIFTNWLKELISFCLQPMILFAYIAIFVMVMDKALIGSATFAGNPPYKGISCNNYCETASGTKTEPTNGVCEDTEIAKYPMEDSVACLMGINSFGTFPGLEIVGISIPILVNVFDGNVKAKIITILKGALVMYLLYKFMDQISGIASRLVGGTALPGSQANALSMFTKTAGYIRGAQKRTERGMRAGAWKGLGAAYRGGGEIGRDIAGSGKETNKDSIGGKGEDSTAKKGQGDDKSGENESGADSKYDSGKGSDDTK